MDFSGNNFNFYSDEFSMQVRVHDLDRLSKDAIFLDLKGELSLYYSQSIKTILNNLIEEGRIKILLEMQKVAYMDSSGMGAFLTTHAKLKKMQGYVRIINPSMEVANMLDLMKLTNFLQIFTTLEDALG
ncbi:MAG: STAS domain-containing protein [Spirochaetota bacterium]